ncbi:MAG: Stk1 family PASTA domain-containing Ser/Thr kinase [Clostridia bacterium]|nr:Stk1 family PASTA domain-containing Ser/Thr kinase [Clostridia bacterium]
MENYVGKRLDGRYEIMEIIGVGGMAVVYKAFDNIDHKIVAVKILKDEFLANEEFKRRFKNESKAIAVLSHQNIVKVFDVSYGDVLQYIVMEYVDGITLKEYMLQQGKIDPREAIYFLTQILRALQHAHDKGIVHRDIKPQNIMLQSDGTIKVTDFGIARFSRSETRTMTDGAIGSVHYISPEQAKGSVTSAKTDIYSVGVILYEMLTGRLPFQSDNAVSVALMQLQNEPDLPRSINPAIPVGLEQIIIRAMQKNQNDRYQSASAMLLDLDAYKKNPNIKFDYNFNSVEAELPTKTAPDYSTGKISVKQTADTEYDDVEEIGSNRGKKVTITILTAVLLALVIFAGFLISMFSSSSNKIEVPNFVNMYFEDAKEQYDDYFSLVPEFRNNPDFADGMIFAQEVPEGRRVVKGSAVTVYVAGNDVSGGIEIPDLTEYSLTVAESKLRALGFKVEIAPEYSDTLEKGSIIRTDPVTGIKAALGSTVTIYYSTDVKSFIVPRVIGMKSSEARAILDDKGLKVVIREEDNKAPKGNVISQSPIEEEVFPGDTVTLYVSTGKDPREVKIPEDLGGKMLADAQKILTDLGFTVVVEAQDSDLPKDTVISVVDAGKSVLPEKTTVTVIVSNGVSITTTEPTTEPSTTAKETTKPSTTKPVVTEPPTTTTKPVVTEPPTTTTKPLTTDPVITEAPETTAPTSFDDSEAVDSEE